MRKVELRMNEEQKYKIIKKLVETSGNKKRAALKLNCTTRTINRLISRYLNQGKAGFIHGNRGRMPSIKKDDQLKASVISLYEELYFGANFTHFKELLAERNQIFVSDSTIHKWFRECDILSPKAQRNTKKEFKKALKARMKRANTMTAILDIEKKIEPLDSRVAHPRRPRSKYFGELVQMDASSLLWFGDKTTYLHLAIDDATSKVLGAYFDKEETLNGYYNVLFQILNIHGVPAKFLTDRRSVFNYESKKNPQLNEDSFTQFSYACKQLGIGLETSSIPQSKGRVERSHQTLQSRLLIELRLANVRTIEEANVFLTHYTAKYNDRFSLPINNTKTVFEVQPSRPRINEILSILSPRVIDSGHSIKYKKQYYSLIDFKGKATYFRKGTKALVMEAFDKRLYASVESQIYSLELIPIRSPYSEEFDPAIKEAKVEKPYIPPMSHPWKRKNFLNYVANQKHQKGLDTY